LPSQCTAVDSDGNEVTFFPPAQTGASTADVDGAAALTGVSCPASNQCTAVDVNGTAVTFNPTSPAGASSAAIDPDPLTGIACPAATFCVAIDDAGYAVQFDPQDPLGPGYSDDRLDGARWLVSISCSSVADCLALDDYGFLYLGTGSPSAPSAPTGPAPTAPSPPTVAPGALAPPVISPDAVAGGPGVSGEQLVLSHTGQARLRFEVTAGVDAPAIESVSISLPRGLAFERSNEDGATVGARHRFSDVLRSGRLLITLKPAAREATVSITVGESTKLETDERKRAGALHRLDFNVGLSVADTAGHSTQLYLHFVKHLR
jgi:hypothetical protein